jgi:hypothetical protein
MHKQSGIVPFVFGVILGILCMIYLPKYVRPYLPESIMGKEIMVKGTVAAKEKKGDSLLLTVSTPEGALLATFKMKANEVNLLVNEKDEIQFSLPKYMPFIEDPKIIRVVKEQQAVPTPVEAPPSAPVKTVGTSTKEIKPRQHVKPQTAAPAPGSVNEVKPPDRGSIAPPTGDKKTEQ